MLHSRSADGATANAGNIADTDPRLLYTNP